MGFSNMGKVSRVRRLKHRCHNDKAERYRMQPCSHKIFKDIKKNPSKLSEKKDWEDATCSVCMEPPHNAVLLLCSSYNKGCRPYMCATGYRFSNCLDQYKKAYTKATSGGADTLCLNDKTQVSELLCPLCRGQVKGWTLVESARKYLNKKKRTCMEENCSFAGNYKQLKKHVKAEHPLARPRKVDPSLEEEWRRLERERDRNDVISTLPPGTIIVGDYVLDPYPNLNRFYGGLDMDMEMDDFSDSFEILGGNRFRSSGFQFHRPSTISYDPYDYDDEEDDDDDEIDEEDIDEIGVRRQLAVTRNIGNAVLPFNRHDRRMLIVSRSYRQRWRRG